MKKEIFINLEKEVITGNVLDVCVENYGVIYNLYKAYNEDSTIDYVNGKKEENELLNEEYDNCIMFFSLRTLWLKNDKRKIINDISKHIKKNGCIYIWDIDKKYGKTFIGNIKILIPNRKIKEIKIKDINIFKNNSKDTIRAILEDKFDIVEIKSSDGIYCIKAIKR